MPKRITVVDTPYQTMAFTSDSRRQMIGLRWNSVAGDWFVDYGIGRAWVMQGRRLLVNVNLLDIAPTTSILFASNASENDRTVTYRSLIDGNTRLFFYTADEVRAALAVR